VAHRLSTVRRCDRIVELENGVVKAYGSFAELQQESQAFDAMARLEVEGEALSQA